MLGDYLLLIQSNLFAKGAATLPLWFALLSFYLFARSSRTKTCQRPWLTSFTLAISAVLGSLLALWLTAMLISTWLPDFLGDNFLKRFFVRNELRKHELTIAVPLLLSGAAIALNCTWRAWTGSWASWPRSMAMNLIYITIGIAAVIWGRYAASILL